MLELADCSADRVHMGNFLDSGLPSTQLDFSEGLILKL